jgi:hypothetical protein
VKRSHCDRLLDALADGQPKSHLELYGLGIMVHSRIADLRARGYTFSVYSKLEGPIGRKERLYYYKLLGRPVSEEEPKPIESAAADSRRDHHNGEPTRSGSSSLTSPEQLTLA